MRIRFQTVALIALVPFLVPGCTQVQAKAAFKDGNKLYKEENYKKAIESYQRAVELEPGMSAGWFYLASSQQALYRPGKAETKERLDKAVEFYKKSLEVNKGLTESEKQVKMNALGALTGIYAEDPYKDYEQAKAYATQLVAENPNDPKNLYAMANLYEKFGHVKEAEDTYRKVMAGNAQDPKACGAMAAFLNKPLWDDQGQIWTEETSKDKKKRSKFDEAIGVLIKCADLTPTDPGGYHKVSTFFWDKGYRDPELTEAQKLDYANKGLEYVDKALQLKPDYFEAIIYKGLLYRLKATVITNPRERQRLIDEAIALQKQGLEIKKQQAAEAAQAAADQAAAAAQ